MSLGTVRAVSFETMIISVMASGTAQIAGCSQRMRSSGCAAQKGFRPANNLNKAEALAVAARSLKLVSEMQASAAMPPVNMPVAAPFIVMPRHHTP